MFEFKDFSIVNIKFRESDINIKYPNNNYIKEQIKELLKGKEYPILNLPNYEVKTVIDIGAGIGTTSVYFKANYPHADIYSFEPSKYNFVYLIENVRDFENIKVYNYGLYDKDSEIKLFRGKYHSFQNSIIHSSETSENSENILLKSSKKQFNSLNLNKINILKIDTEGCEIPILTSISNILDNIDIIYIEYHSESDRLEIDRILSPYFYLFYSKTMFIHRGINSYISKKILEMYPNLTHKELK